MTMADNEIEDITFITEPDGDIFPEKELPENSRQLKGFVWRGDERILSKDDIFDEDDNNLILPIIQGINNPIDVDIDPTEALEEEKKRDSINLSRPRATPPVVNPKHPRKQLIPIEKDSTVN